MHKQLNKRLAVIESKQPAADKEEYSRWWASQLTDDELKQFMALERTGGTVHTKAHGTVSFAAFGGVR